MEAALEDHLSLIGVGLGLAPDWAKHLEAQSDAVWPASVNQPISSCQVKRFTRMALRLDLACGRQDKCNKLGLSSAHGVRGREDAKLASSALHGEFRDRGRTVQRPIFCDARKIFQSILTGLSEN
jgi:hypothetical protein